MGLVTGEFKHPTIKHVQITVDAKDKKEIRESWEIISLDTHFSSIRTPQDLVELGEWLVKMGTELPRKFTHEGRKRRKVRLTNPKIL